jgi:hypothetical protein
MVSPLRRSCAGHFPGSNRCCLDGFSRSKIFGVNPMTLFALRANHPRQCAAWKGLRWNLFLVCVSITTRGRLGCKQDFAVLAAELEVSGCTAIPVAVSVSINPP